MKELRFFFFRALHRSRYTVFSQCIVRLLWANSAQHLSRFTMLFRGVMTPSLMPAGPDVQHMLDPSSMSESQSQARRGVQEPDRPCLTNRHKGTPKRPRLCPISHRFRTQSRSATRQATAHAQHSPDTTQESPARDPSLSICSSLTTYNLPRHLHSQRTTSLSVFADACTRAGMLAHLC